MKDKKMGALAIFLYLTCVPVAIYVRGLVISFTWLWFIVPITGWRAISIVEGVGLSIFCSILTNNATKTKEQKSPKEEKNTRYFFILVGKAYGQILISLVLLGVAWLWFTFAIH